MYNKLHDGPTHLPTGPRNYQTLPKTKPHASLAALQWAAARANQSYGVFTLGLTLEDETRIQAEYETYRRELKANAEARRAERVDEASIPGEKLSSGKPLETA